METAKLKKFAQFARRSLIEQVSGKLQQVLAEDSAARREEPKAVEDLAAQIKAHGRDQVIEKVAYTWFNRFCALRFMDVNRYTRIGVVSPAEGQFQPEILAEAKMGHIDEDMVPEKTRQQIFALLNGTTPSRDPQAEAYRLLVVAACNDYHKAMDYLFEKIADYTELLMPDDLLSGNSILAYTREAMTPDACQDVEVIGWLYQFYISEKKDEVFDGLKKNKKITPENIPAATQLFTPHWIVKYLVENSLGRLWMLNRPNSRLAEKMAYYIKPETPETDFLKISKPEEIKVCDPACGSAHMLVYSFDILYFIYEEEGYEATEIPRLILENNLFGIEIDKRAGELAAFALTMKARAKQRRFFSKKVAPNICVLENIHFEEAELKDYMDFIGWDLFTAPLQTTLRQFEEADNFGSLIRPKVTDVNSMLKILEAKNVSGQIFLIRTHKKVLQALRQADYLSPKYHVVIANPPYMGGKGMNGRLGSWVKDNYPNSKSDLFAVFVERIMDLVSRGGFMGLMTPFTWMFLSSYEKLRSRILNENTITTLVRPEYHAFFESAFVPICGFTLFRQKLPDYRGAYVDLTSFYGADRQSVITLEAIRNPNCGWLFRASATDIKKIPGSPIAYWVSDKVRAIFDTFPPLANSAPTKQGLATGNNDRFMRFWFEPQINTIGFEFSDRNAATESDLKWFPCNKGGEFRKWFGNNYFVVHWHRDGEEIKAFSDENGKLRSRPQNQNFYFQKGLTWSAISSSNLSMRYSPQGHMFETKGAMCFPKNEGILYSALGYCNSKLVNNFLKAVSPTLDFHEGPVGKLPFRYEDSVCEDVKKSICLSKVDWDSFELSWELTSIPLLHTDYRQPTDMTLEMQRLEEDNNRIFIEAYGLQDELTPEVPIKEITMTCNPHYRYGVDECEVGSEKWKAMEVRLLEDTMKEFISYSVGCMFGRYSLDMPGLVLANQGETVEDYNKKFEEWKNQTGITSQTEIMFHPDKDNVIPVLDGDWFTDDIVERFQRFLHITFGDEHYEANLEFIEKALDKDIRKYFLKDFYNDHVRRYKKRPIYWLFSSSKGSFNALIYMHRYRPDTV
ncbi:MAG: BREX-1 system adenine-specific DNA-methyltransferase PglX, partial [Deltaproteobacteria bacterium]|nr:BREX-1 system adenine-specific DNA-methyltransferase PglX [Deltaproteobacteria bacterium]